MPRKKTEEEKQAVSIPRKMKWASIPNPRYILPQEYDPASGAARPYEPTPAATTFIHDEAQKGSTWGAIANGMGIGTDALREMRKRYPETIQGAFDRGRANIVARLSHVLVNKALEGNTVELLFALKTLGGFREGTPTEGQPTVNVNISIPAPLPAHEVERIIGRVDVTATDVEPEPIAPEPVEPFE